MTKPQRETQCCWLQPEDRVLDDHRRRKVRGEVHESREIEILEENTNHWLMFEHHVCGPVSKHRNFSCYILQKNTCSEEHNRNQSIYNVSQNAG